MTDEIENPDVDKAVEEQGPQAGERLANARREKQIGILEVAKELHLDEPKVRALERNEFALLGAPVFAKGHLKKYARLVDVSVDDVMAEYYELTRSDGMPPLVGKVRKPIREIRLGRWLLAIVLLAIAAIVYWWFFEREVVGTGGEQGNRLSLPQQSAPEVSPATNPEVEPAPEQVEEEPAAEPQGNTTPDVAAQPPTETTVPPVPVDEAVDDEVQVALMFSGDCWTEITDASGEQLFFALGKDGRSVNISGEAPLTVLFGNAENVSLRVNGIDYPIAAGSRRGKTARFTINNPARKN